MQYIVEFKGNRRQVYTAPEGLAVEANKYVIVQAERGEDMGLVKRQITSGVKVETDESHRIVRLATDNDIERLNFNRQKELESKAECLNFIAKHQLKMKLVDVEYQYDCNKITFYFTAEKRVDFRELVKDLAATFRTRIELRQIGVRDEAKRIGGYGICGKEQCCSSFLNEFQTISTQMARTQNLALNPQKISGNCGRLLCCLLYEQKYYEEALPEYPEIGTRFKLGEDAGIIEKCNIFFEEITLKFDDGNIRVVNLAEYKRALQRSEFVVIQKPKPAVVSNGDNSNQG